MLTSLISSQVCAEQMTTIVGHHLTRYSVPVLFLFLKHEKIDMLF